MTATTKDAAEPIATANVVNQNARLLERAFEHTAIENPAESSQLQ